MVPPVPFPLFFTWRSCPASPRLFALSLATPNSPISESYAQRKKLTIYFIYSKISVVLMSVSGLVDVCCDSQTEGLGFDPPTCFFLFNFFFNSPREKRRRAPPRSRPFFLTYFSLAFLCCRLPRAFLSGMSRHTPARCPNAPLPALSLSFLFLLLFSAAACLAPFSRVCPDIPPLVAPTPPSLPPRPLSLF